MFLRALAICTMLSLFAWSQMPSHKPDHGENRSRTSICGAEVPAVVRYIDRSSYYEWLTEDVGYIITDPERSAFKMLRNDEERGNFIEAFWRRRDPTHSHIASRNLIRLRLPNIHENLFLRQECLTCRANTHPVVGGQPCPTKLYRVSVMYEQRQSNDQQSGSAQR